MMRRILDTFSIQFPIIRVSPYSYNSIIVSILSFDFFLLLLCSTIPSHASFLLLSPFCFIRFSRFCIRFYFWFDVDSGKMGTDGRTRFSFLSPGRSCDPSLRLHVRRRERDDQKSGRGCSAPYHKHTHTVPAVPREGTERRTVGVGVVFRSPPAPPPVPE